MFVGVKGQNRQGICFLLLLAVGTATLAGCVGKKYGFPGFGTRQASSSESKEQPTEESNISKEKKESALNHVASLDQADKSRILPTSSQVKERAGDSKPGVAHISSIANSGPQKTDFDEIDQAFQEWVTRKSGTQKDAMQEELGDYKKLVSEVEQGTSSLDALKASLAKLNEDKTSSRASEQKGESPTQPTGHQQYLSESGMTPPAIKETAGIATVSVPESKSAEETDLSVEFPWFSGSGKLPKPETETANTKGQHPQNDKNHIRDLLTRARRLIRENNLLEARLIAETARTIKKKTEAVFTTEESTPEQILAEIAQREQERKEKLTASLDSNNQTDASFRKARETASSQQQQPAPVVIDLSREWLNSTETSGAGSSDDVTRFERSTATSNRAARLPVITPAGEPYRAVPEQRKIEIISYDSAIETAQGNPTELPESQRILLLGEDSGNKPVANEPATQVAGVSLPPLHVGVEENQNEQNIQLENEPGSAPLLIAPEVASGEVEEKSSEFDEFAAGFAEIGVEASPEIEEAPLLIDEEELRSHAADSPRMSATMLVLTICGIAFAVLMLVRWRR